MSISRRKLLGMTASIGALGLAGCGQTEDPSGDTATAGTATDTATQTETEHHEDSTGEDHHDEETDHHDEETESDHHHEVGEPTDAAEVSMVTRDDGSHFEPHVVRVNEGGTVTFTIDAGDHSTVAYHPDNGDPQLVPDGASSWDSGLLTESGAEFTQTFETPGVYHYYCQPHRSTGMLGSVIVGEPDTEGQPALGSPPESLSDVERTKIEELNGTITDALSHEG